MVFINFIRFWIGMIGQLINISQNNLPYHPLEGVGYESLGDWHSTKKISEVENQRMPGMEDMVVNVAFMLISLRVWILTSKFLKMILPDDKTRLQELIKALSICGSFLSAMKRKERLRNWRTNVSSCFLG